MPEPVIFDAVELSTGTGLRRARKLVAGGAEDCANSASATISSLIALTVARLMERDIRAGIVALDDSREPREVHLTAVTASDSDERVGERWARHFEDVGAHAHTF